MALLPVAASHAASRTEFVSLKSPESISEQLEEWFDRDALFDARLFEGYTGWKQQLSHALPHSSLLRNNLPGVLKRYPVTLRR